MMLTGIILSIIIFSLILYRLLTTNTWNTGKKLFVGFVSSILVDYLVNLLLFLKIIPLDAYSIFLMNAPVSAIGFVMAFLMYKQKF